jgi:hypothetical protein
MRFQVLTDVNIKMTVWDTAPCSFLEVGLGRTSEVLIASLFSSMSVPDYPVMEAVNNSEISVNFYDAIGTTSQKTHLYM